MWRWLTVALTAIAGVFGIQYYRSEAKRYEAQADANEAESEALTRQSEAATAQAEENQERVETIRNSSVDRDYFNSDRKL